MRVQVALALERQAWMEDEACKRAWLPSKPAGQCKQCALGETTCVQTRNHPGLGETPQPKPLWKPNIRPMTKDLTQVPAPAPAAPRPLELDYRFFA